MTAVLKASDWLNGQLSSVMQLDSLEALCMEYHVCTSLYWKELRLNAAPYSTCISMMELQFMTFTSTVVAA